MRPFVPQITRLPARTVLTLTTIGDPNTLGGVFPALYGTAYGTKFKVFKPKKKVMTVGPCSAFWPDAHRKPKAKWTGIWNLEVSPFVTTKALIQKDPAFNVVVKKLPAASVAEVLYIGTYANETKTIKELHAFITSSGYSIVGDHEEVYLTKPGPKAKTVIRYAIKKATKRR